MYLNLHERGDSSVIYKVSEKFQIKDGLIPAPLYASLHSGSDDWFKSRTDIRDVEIIKSSYFDFRGINFITLSFNGFRNDSYTSVMVGNLSFIVINNLKNILHLSNKPTDNVKHLTELVGKVDIYVLGTIKLSGLRKIKRENRYEYFQVPNDEIVFLVSDTVKEDYVSTEPRWSEIASYLRRELLDVRSEVRYVPHEYINSFLKPVVSIPTTSISDYQRIAAELVDKTYPKLVKEKKIRKKKVVTIEDDDDNPDEPELEAVITSVDALT